MKYKFILLRSGEDVTSGLSVTIKESATALSTATRDGEETGWLVWLAWLAVLLKVLVVSHVWYGDDGSVGSESEEMAED